MIKKVKFDTDDYYGAICVLENYLDGALADYECDQVENDLLIEHSINAIELLELSLFGYGLSREYRERYEKKKKEIEEKSFTNTK